MLGLTGGKVTFMQVREQCEKNTCKKLCIATYNAVKPLTFLHKAAAGTNTTSRVLHNVNSAESMGVYGNNSAVRHRLR